METNRSAGPGSEALVISASIASHQPHEDKDGLSIAESTTDQRGQTETSTGDVATVVIEVLDSPATRREKNAQKKAERLRRVSPINTVETTESGPSNVELGSASREDIEMDTNSELTALSSDSEDENEGPMEIADVHMPEIAVSPSKKGRVQDLGKVVLADDEWLPAGTLGMFKQIFIYQNLTSTFT
jgi:hypothetical protein